MRTNRRFQHDTEIITDYYPDTSSRLGSLVPITKQITHTTAATHVGENATLRIYQRRVEIKMPGVQPPHLQNTSRGVVSLDFEGKAKKRMMNALNEWRINPNHKAYFITLTYPAQWPKTWREWKQDLEAFRRKLLAVLPECEGFWRLELQKRGAPHYHLVITFRKGFITNKRLKKLVTSWWRDIAHSNDQYQGKYATRVDVMHQQSAVYKYISKYVNKSGGRPVDDDGVILQDDDAHEAGTMGRHWGKIGKPSREPYAEFDMLGIDAIVELKAVVIGWLRGKKLRYADYLCGTPRTMSWDCVGIPGYALLLILDQLRIGRGLLPHERARVLSTA